MYTKKFEVYGNCKIFIKCVVKFQKKTLKNCATSYAVSIAKEHVFTIIRKE